MENIKEKVYCILIDSDNISQNYLKDILDEVLKYGCVYIRRAYGDASAANKKDWLKIASENSIEYVHQLSIIKGKNNADSRLIIDAMDILYTKKVDGFVIVSSDSDFAPLSIRLRNEGKDVIGIGYRTTPKQFISACNEFKYIEYLSTKNAIVNASDPKLQADVTPDILKKEEEDRKDIEKLIIQILGDADGPVLLSLLKEKLIKARSDFDTRKYGYKKMNKFLESFDVLFLDNKKNMVKLKNE